MPDEDIVTATNRCTKLIFETATDVRKFEVDLFWKRSLFFWGFIAAAFVAYVSIKDAPDLSLAVACFGFVCSFAWTLGNRGSKYWQESWEKKVEDIEVLATGLAMFANPEPPDRSKGWWLRGRRMSVLKLTIALSDFTVLIWVGLLARMSALSWHATHPDAMAMWETLVGLRAYVWVGMPAATALFAVLMLLKGRTTLKNAGIPTAESPSSPVGRHGAMTGLRKQEDMWTK